MAEKLSRMLITLVLMTLLVLFAMAALVLRNDLWAIVAWVLMALTMVPVWFLLALPAVAMAQAILSAGVTGWLLWRAHQVTLVNR